MTIGPIEVQSQTYIFDPHPLFPFRVVAKRYWTEDYIPSEPSAKTPRNALTLIFAHAAGFHKELWEPTIHGLFEKQRAGHCSFQFQDMWSFDAPNHGDAAVLNEDVLSSDQEVFFWENYARSIHAFLTGFRSGVGVDFSKRTLVAVGHCMGAISLMLATRICSPLIKFASMHLFEPWFPGKYDQGWSSRLVEATKRRRDVWPSAEDAFQVMKKRPAWQKWDRRVLMLYTEKGLRPLPTAEHLDATDGVTLKCTKDQEVATYRDQRSHSIAYENLARISKEIPTHITYGEIADFLPVECCQDVLNSAAGWGPSFASVTIVAGAGHLIVQTHPDEVADVIWKSLIQSHSRLPDEPVYMSVEVPGVLIDLKRCENILQTLSFGIWKTYVWLTSS